jgi:hypothetical protein
MINADLDGGSQLFRPLAQQGTRRGTVNLRLRTVLPRNLLSSSAVFESYQAC